MGIPSPILHCSNRFGWYGQGVPSSFAIQIVGLQHTERFEVASPSRETLRQLEGAFGKAEPGRNPAAPPHPWGKDGGTRAWRPLFLGGHSPPECYRERTCTRVAKRGFIGGESWVGSMNGFYYRYSTSMARPTTVLLCGITHGIVDREHL